MHGSGYIKSQYLWSPHHVSWVGFIQVSQTAGNASLLRSTAWEVFGDNHLSLLHALIHVECFSEGSSAMERATAFAQLGTIIAARKGHKAAEEVFKHAERWFAMVSDSCNEEKASFCI